ncbi:MAG: SRPBCC domain-containing protein [Bdellovibrionaceae bacterium]|nr:SRPBCC domain-containing protein [Pseudobdellovibrionaceae bacterium]
MNNNSNKMFHQMDKQDVQFLNSFPIEIKRNFNAPIGRVWKSWCCSEMMKQWFGPENYTCPDAQINFEEGGKYLIAMEDARGEVMWSTGVYKKINPFQKIVLLDAFSDAHGNVISPAKAGLPGKWDSDYCTITVEFQSTPEDGTIMNLRHEGIPKEMYNDCSQGWAQSFNKLKKLVEGN